MAGGDVFFEGGLDGFVAFQAFFFGAGEGLEDSLVVTGEHFEKLGQQAVPVVEHFPAADAAGQGDVALDSFLDGGPGNDRIKGGSLDSTLIGGTGDDKLTGGKGDNLLIGGLGNDTLKGGRGVNLLIGGIGADRLTGGRLEDIVVAGDTTLDATALASILAEWSSSNTFANSESICNGTARCSWSTSTTKARVKRFLSSAILGLAKLIMRCSVD